MTMLGITLSSDVTSFHAMTGYLRMRHVMSLLGVCDTRVRELVRAGRIKRTRMSYARSYVYDYASVMAEVERRKAWVSE